MNYQPIQPIMEGYRLSPQQKRLWLLAQEQSLQPYRLQALVTLDGPLNTEQLQSALNDLGKRYEILRTVFQLLPGTTIPAQVIYDEPLLDFQTNDLSHLDPAQQQIEIGAAIRATQQMPFDVVHGPLLKAQLLKLLDTRHQLILTASALIADASTLRLLIEEMSQRYAGQSPVSVTDDDLIQYADLAEWQHDLIESGEDEAIAGRQFWQAQDLASSLIVPFPQRSPGGPSRFEPRFVCVDLPPAVVISLRQLAAAYEISPALIMLTAWQTLVWRLTSQSELVVGVACDGRTYEELIRAIGPLAKTLPLHSRLESGLSFRAVLSQASEMWSEALDRQEFLDWDGLTGQVTAFCQLAFDFSDLTTFEAGDLTFALAELSGVVDQFELKLSAQQRPEEFGALLWFDAKRFQAADVDRLAEQFRTLLTEIMATPEADIDALDILPAEQRRQLLVDFNTTATDYPQYRGIHHLIEEQAAGAPDQIAVIFEEQELSYGQLNARANQLAHHLRALGVKPGTLVALHLERSVEMIVGLLGVLKAGGAYVPLDPDYPPARLALTLEDTRTPIALTQARLEPKLPPAAMTVIRLDHDWADIAQHPTENLANLTTPEQLAYVIFTSGSTGRPKGVSITHRNLIHSTQARMSYYREPVNRFLLLSSYAFDSSVAGLFWTLCTGGTLVLPIEGVQRDPQALIRLIAHRQVTHLLSLPSLYGLLLEEDRAQNLSSLRTAIVAGEICPRTLIIQHRVRLPQANLFNEYGPTEGTVWSSVYNCLSSETDESVPIGRPISNVQIYILDARLRPVPIGVPGEIYIGGAGVALGYLNQPELTAERFIPDPFSDQAEAKLYKTGDLARYRPDGNIEFLGRVDHQVKIRGYRIELEEIEAALGQHPSVKHVAVVAKDIISKPVELSDDDGHPAETETVVRGLRSLNSIEAEQLLAEIELLTEDEVTAQLIT